jgi:hypothetical protein
MWMAGSASAAATSVKLARALTKTFDVLAFMCRTSQPAQLPLSTRSPNFPRYIASDFLQYLSERPEMSSQ